MTSNNRHNIQDQIGAHLTTRRNNSSCNQRRTSRRTHTQTRRNNNKNTTNRRQRPNHTNNRVRRRHTTYLAPTRRRTYRRRSRNLRHSQRQNTESQGLADYQDRPRRSNRRRQLTSNQDRRATTLNNKGDAFKRRWPLSVVGRQATDIPPLSPVVRDPHLEQPIKGVRGSEQPFISIHQLQYQGLHNHLSSLCGVSPPFLSGA